MPVRRRPAAVARRPGALPPPWRHRARDPRPTPTSAAARGMCGRCDLSRRTCGSQQQRPDRPDHQADDAGGEGRPALRHLRVRADRGHDRPGRRRAQPAGARRRERQGADREVPRRRGHLLRLVEQRGQPRADRRPVQRAAAGGDLTAVRHPAADQHRPGARSRHPGRPAGNPAARQHGAGCGTQRAQRLRRGPDQRQGAAGHRHQPELRTRGRRQRERAEPGHRCAVVRLRPVAGVRPGVGERRRLPERQRGRHGEALPGPRRHGDRQPLRRADHQPHPRRVGVTSTPRRSEPRSTAASTRS